MEIENMKSVIDRVFDNNEDINPNTTGEIRDSIETALDYLDQGKLRVAEPLGNSKWHVNQWLKKAVLLSFKINDMDVISEDQKVKTLVQLIGGTKFPLSFQDGIKKILKKLVLEQFLEVW